MRDGKWGECGQGPVGAAWEQPHCRNAEAQHSGRGSRQRARSNGASNARLQKSRLYTSGTVTVRGGGRERCKADVFQKNPFLQLGERRAPEVAWREGGREVASCNCKEWREGMGRFEGKLAGRTW